MTNSTRVDASLAGYVFTNRLIADLNITVLLLQAAKTDKQQKIHIRTYFLKLFKSSTNAQQL
ncbi:hypothetical protein BV372_26790 [Nostoc sp. T09]|uniref:hypothetical protein n=1 Tax=Nostoc sp. T09 TaxID=1932621 RepID=UPI000A3CBF38|nr:hypothetical protein [Nostoc sp. T09]OUL26483.1 hypothetical protein BV372_26790 [Nostoc sp. T09]